MTQTTTWRRLGLGLTAMALLTTACGLKPEAKDALRQGGGGGLIDGEVVDPGDGTGVDDGTGTGTGGTGTGTGGTGTGTGGTGTGTGGTGTGTGGTGTGGTGTGGTGTGGTGTGGTGTGGTGTGGTGTNTGPGNTTGIRDGKIYLALHGPLTGAGVPQDSFKSGTKLYWANGAHKIRGMEVVADAFDDEYSPSGAVKACRAAAPEYFMIIGGAGTDQIQACARDDRVQRGGVPVVSAGVTTNGLTTLPNYFAASLTYAQQGPTVVKMAREKGFLTASKGWGLVISETPNFTDAKESIQNALKAANVKYTYIPVPKTGGDSTTVANKLRAGGYETVFFLGQPLFFAEVVGKTGCNVTYCPQYTGVGISMGVNTVANLACGGTGGTFKGEFLSPYPGVERAAQLAPGVTFKDDIEFTIYGVMQMIDQMFQSIPASVPLTRQNFVAAVAKGNFKGGIFNAARFGGSTHFGGTAAFYLKAKCGPGNTSKWETDGGPTR